MEQKLKSNVKKAISEYFEYISKNKKSDYIPASGKCIGIEELLNMTEASLDMHLTTGRFNSEFEAGLSKFLNVKYCMTANSGSSANLLALSALTSYKLKERRLKIGDEVITTATGFPTTINPIILLGLVPVFIDCKLETYNIDTDKIEKAITEKTKAIMIAHTLGNTFNLDKIQKLCKKYNLWLIEDNCDALGTEYDGKYTGTFGDIGTFSFYPAHHITMGEGGAVVTNNKLLYSIMRSFRDWGRDCICDPGQDNRCNKRFKQQLGKLPFGFDHKYIYSHIGYNLKITDWQAAIGCAQLKKLPSFIKKRRENFDLLYKKLSDLKEYFILPEAEKKSNPSWFGFLVSVKPECKFTKQELVEYLENNGIGTRQLFAGNILRQPYFVENDIKLRIQDSKVLLSNKLSNKYYGLLPNSEYIMNNTFWVGVFPALNKKEMNKISDTIHNFIKLKKN